MNDLLNNPPIPAWATKVRQELDFGTIYSYFDHLLPGDATDVGLGATARWNGNEWSTEPVMAYIMRAPDDMTGAQTLELARQLFRAARMIFEFQSEEAPEASPAPALATEATRSVGAVVATDFASLRGNPPVPTWATSVEQSWDKNELVTQFFRGNPSDAVSLVQVLNAEHESGPWTCREGAKVSLYADGEYTASEARELAAELMAMADALDPGPAKA